MSLMTGLFNVLALLYIGRAVQLAVRIVRNWAALRQEPLTREKQRLAEQAAFFLGVPPAVFIHELAHAVMIVLFGGRVVEFGYRVFWGYVVPAGQFTPTQNWFIALAGTLGSLAFGGLLWLALRRNHSRTLRYFGLRAFRFQIYFSLLYYPIMTLFLPIGDWRMIYDFNATPVLSGVTAVAHAALLVLFWRAERRGFFEMASFESTAAQSRYESVLAAADAGNPDAALQVIATLWSGDAPREAGRRLSEYLERYPTSGAGWLQKAIQAGGGAQSVNREAFEAAGKALSFGLASGDHRGLAQQIRATYYLQRGDGAGAERELAGVPEPPVNGVGDIAPARRAELHYLSAQAYRRQHKYDAAVAEIDQALHWAREMNMEPMMQRYADELSLIAAHAGWSQADVEQKSLLYNRPAP